MQVVVGRASTVASNADWLAGGDRSMVGHGFGFEMRADRRCPIRVSDVDVVAKAVRFKDGRLHNAISWSAHGAVPLRTIHVAGADVYPLVAKRPVASRVGVITETLQE